MSLDAIGLAKDFSIFDSSILSEEDKANQRRFPTPKEFIDSASVGGAELNFDELGKNYAKHYKDYATKSVGLSPALADAKALAIQNMFFTGKDGAQFNDAWNGILNPQQAQVQAEQQAQANKGEAGHLDNIARGYYQQSAANFVSSAMRDMEQADSATRVRAGQDWLSNQAANDNSQLVMGGGNQAVDLNNKLSDPLPTDPYGKIAQTNESAAVQNIQQAQTQLDKASALPESKGVTEFSKTEGFFDAAGQLIMNPIDTALPLVEQSLAPMASQLGAAAVGGVVGGIPGAMAAGGTASYEVNRAAKILEEAQKTGRPLIDVVRDAQARGEIQGEASRYATVVGSADALSMGAAGVTMPARTLLGRAAIQTGLQAGLGGAGEAGGQIAAAGEITSGRDIAAEALLEIPFGAAEVGISALNRPRTQADRTPPNESANRQGLGTTTVIPQPTQPNANPLGQFVQQAPQPQTANQAGRAPYGNPNVTRSFSGNGLTEQAVRGKSIGDLIASGEGDYQSFNRGKAGDSAGEKIDFSQMTVAELMQRQALPIGNPDRIFTVGKYQAIPETFAEAVQKLGIPADTKVTPALQEYIFSEYLLKDKRPDIRDYITGKSDNLKNAQKAGAMEWAAVADPDTGLSFHGKVGNNKASISSDAFGRSLAAIRQAYADAVSQGANADEAWSRAVNGASSATPLPTVRTSTGFQNTAAEQPKDNVVNALASSQLSMSPELPASLAVQNTTNIPVENKLPKAEIYDAQNNKYNAQYEVVDAAALLPTIEKADNQYRDRNRTESQRQIDSIATDPNYGRLNMLHSTFTDGAPVLQQDNTILAGNGRIAGLKKAYDAGSAENYKRSLISDLSSKGIDTTPIEQMQSPILVRRLTDEVDTKKVSVLSNVGSGMAMSPSEQAIIDAGYIQSLHDFTPDDTGDITFQSASGLFKRLAKAVPTTERNSILTDENKVGADGVKRVKNALLYMAYGDSPALRQMTESGTPDHVNVTKALVKAAPVLAELRDNIRQGIFHDVDLTPAIIDSFALFSQIKKDPNNTIESWLNQQDAFSQVKPEVKVLIQRLDAATRRPNQLADFLVSYANKLKTYGSPKQVGLLEANIAPSQLEVLNRASTDTPLSTNGGNNERSSASRGDQSIAQPNAENRGESRVNETNGGGYAGNGSVSSNSLYNISPRQANLTGNDTKLTTAWKLIASQEDAFQLPISTKKTLSEIAADYDPTIKVELGTENKNQRQLVIRVPIGKGFQEATVTEGKGRDKTIYLDISEFNTGGGGRTVYQMVGDYAHNTGKVFIGDPNGLSAIAQIRRTENMLSSALRWGTTDHLQPHELQLKPDSNKVTPLQWKVGDSEFNIDQMLRASMGNLLNQIPELGQIRYNFESQQFEETLPNGKIDTVTEADFGELAKSRGARAAQAGRTTLKRAVVSASILSGQGQAAWNAVLGNLIRQSGQQLDNPLQGILYGLSPSLDQVVHQVATDKKLSDLAEDALLSVFGESPKNQTIADRLLRQFFFDNFVQSETYPDSRSFVTARMNELRSSGALKAISDQYFSGNNGFKLKDDANRKPISAEKAEAAIRRILGDIPFETTIPDEIRSGAGEAADRVKGAFANGKIYIDTSTIGSVAEAEALAVEELVHRGVANLFGPDYDARLTELYDAIGGEPGIRRFISQHKIEMADDYFNQSPQAQMDELLAHIEANQATLTVRVKRAFQRVLAHLRNAIRKLNTKVLHNVSDSDIVLIARMARNAAQDVVSNPSTNTRFHLDPEQAAAAHDFSNIKRLHDQRKRRSGRLGRYLKTEYQTWGDRKASVSAGLFKSESAERAATVRWAKRHLFSDSFLGRDVADAKRGLDWDKAVVSEGVKSDVVALEALIENIYGKHRSELSRDEQEQFHQALTGKIAFPNEAIQRDVNVFRARIDEASQKLIAEKYREMQMRIDELNDEGKAAIAQLADEWLDPNYQYEEGQPIPKALMQIHRLQMQINTIEGNKGAYLNRSYQAFTDPKWVERVKRKPVYQEAIQFIQDENNLSQDKAEAALNTWLEGTRGHTNMISFSGLGGTNEGIMKRKRKDMPLVLRQVLGEFTDPVYNYANTITQVGAYVAHQQYQMTLRHLLLSMPDIATVGEGSGNKVEKFPETAAYSVLNDVFVEKKFLDELQEFGVDKPLIDNPLMKAWVSTSAAVKLGKTIGSPTTQMRNFWSGLLLLAQAGHSPFGEFKDTYELMRYAKNRVNVFTGDLMLGKQEAMLLNQKYVRLGVRRDGASSGELEKIFNDFHQMDTAVREQGLLSQSFSLLVRSYQFSDDFFKIIHFEKGLADLKKTGMSEADAELEAARRTRDTMPTYSMVPRWVRNVRQFPAMGSFVAFPYEQLRTLKNNLAYMAGDVQRYRETGNSQWLMMAGKRAMGLTVGFALPSIAAAASMWMFGIDDEDDDALDYFGSDWRRGQLRLYLGKGENGMNYLDLTSLVPSEYVLRSIRQAWIAGDEKGAWAGLWEGALTLGKPYYQWDIATQGFKSVFDNYDSSTGRPIYGEGKSLGDLLGEPGKNQQHWGQLFNYVSRQFGPGVVQNMNDFSRALAGTVSETGEAGLFSSLLNEHAAGLGGNLSRSGKEFTEADAVAALLGFRVTTQDVNTLGVMASGQTRSKIAAYSAEFKQALDTTVDLSPEFIDRRIEQVLSDRQRAYEKMQDLIHFYKKKNRSESEIADLLYEKDRSLGKEQVRQLVRGKIPQFEPSKELLSRSLTITDKIANPQARLQAKRTLAERYRYVVKRAAEMQRQ